MGNSQEGRFMFKISVFKISMIAVIVVIGAIVIIAATRPATFRVERSTRISAPPERIFHYVNDFHQWGVWSPYEKLDPSMKRTYGGAAAGKGAVYNMIGGDFETGLASLKAVSEK
jgi:hypothetical protein